MSKLLIIAPIFHEYHLFIQKAAETIFEEVTFIPEFPNTLLFKFTKRIPLLKKLHMRLHLLKLRNLNKFDKILCIRCHYWEKKDVEILKHSDVIYYNWDSVKNNPSALTFANKGIKVATFDKQDSIRYGFRYIPLFHSENYGMSDRSTTRKVYDFNMICSGHSERINIANKLIKLNIKSYIHIYLPILVQLKHLFSGKYNRDDLKVTSTRSLSDESVAIIMSKSKIALDFAHPNQFGATSRTIEALASSTFLLTNNPGSLQLAIEYNLENNVELYSSLEDLLEKLKRLLDTGVSFSGQTLTRPKTVWLQEIFCN